MAERVRPGVRALGAGRPQGSESKGQETGWGCGDCQAAGERVWGKQEGRRPRQGGGGEGREELEGVPCCCRRAGRALGAGSPGGQVAGRLACACPALGPRLHLLGASVSRLSSPSSCFFPNLVFLFSPSHLSARPRLPFLP